MATKGTVIERDKGFNRIMDAFVKKGDMVVKVGIQGSESKQKHTGDFGKHQRPLTNLEVGVIHEFGAPGASIPERSFIRSTATKNAKKYFSTLKTITKGIIAGVIDVRRGLELLGIQVEADMKSTMTKGIAPPLKHRRKVPKGVAPGKQVPLVNTGQLRNSITHVVTKAGH
jgi:hypothetical protein